jgi:parvulin-like peptidyl-prolyl isomerase
VPTLDAATYPGALQQVLERTFYTETDFRTEIEQSLVRERVEKAFGEERVPVNQEQIHARHILVGTPDQAAEIKQQLDGGADFAELARTRTIDSGTMSTDGDLGWFTRGMMDSLFEAAAFALEPGQISSPVQTSNGFHIIQVLERDPARPVAEAQLQALRRKAFSDALDRRRNSDVRLQLSSGERDWVLSRLGVRP